MCPQRGFTLLEIMLAMTLLSIMVALLFASLRIGSESWNAGENKIEQVNEKAVVYQFFKRHLTTIRPVWDDFSGSGRHFSFQGRSDRLEFVSLFPASAGRKGLQLFAIGPDPRQSDVVSVVLSPFYPSEVNREWREERETLLEHVVSFELEYFEQTATGTGNWVGDWLDRERLPPLIKVRIELEDGSYWPDMIFPLRLGTTSATVPSMANDRDQDNE